MTITDPAALEAILREAPLLYLSMAADPAPYVVPVCFGVEGSVLYVHGATAGRKIDLIRANPAVGFCACAGVAVRTRPAACSSTARGMSVVGTGRARIVDDPQERVRGLDAIMRHYGTSEDGPGAPRVGEAPGDDRPFVYAPKSLSRTAVIAIRIESIRGKGTGGAAEYPPAGR